jgi:hypothetical protein
MASMYGGAQCSPNHQRTQFLDSTFAGLSVGDNRTALLIDGNDGRLEVVGGEEPITLAELVLLPTF